MEKSSNCKYSIQDFLKLVNRLKASNSFRGDKPLKRMPLRSNLINKVTETSSAIKLENSDTLKEELGEMLLQIAYHCEIDEYENFSFNDIVDKICKKIISKYPQVLSSRDESYNKCRIYNLRDRNPRENYDQETKTSSKNLSALTKTLKIQEKASCLGYGLFSIEDALNETFERLHYLETLIINGRSDYFNKELGALLFSVTDIARLLGIDAETSLYETCEKFKNEFLYK